MFYNLENFFDTIDDPLTNDEEYLPNADKRWNTDKYNRKTKNICEVITKINDGKLPNLLGVCEIEHKSILTDISNNLTNSNYGISHFESPDKRGIDVGLLYDNNIFKLISEKAINVELQVSRHSQELGNSSKSKEVTHTVKTRDILQTKLSYLTDTLCVFVCHFPSRRGGKEASDYKRSQVAQTLRTAIDFEQAKNPRLKFIIMGDFNDEPLDHAIKSVLKADKASTTNTGLINLFYDLDVNKEGSYKYHNEMNMLDQIIISSNLWNPSVTSNIYNPSWLIQTGKYAGFPLRTFGGKNYLGGYSDHFPVFATLYNH